VLSKFKLQNVVKTVLVLKFNKLTLHKWVAGSQ